MGGNPTGFGDVCCFTRWLNSFMSILQHGGCCPSFVMHRHGLWTNRMQQGSDQESTDVTGIITLPKASSSPLKMGHPKRKVVFVNLFSGAMLVSGGCLFACYSVHLCFIYIYSSCIHILLRCYRKTLDSSIWKVWNQNCPVHRFADTIRLAPARMQSSPPGLFHF